MPRVESFQTPLLWTVYLALPAAGWGLFHGMPLGLSGAFAVFLVWWVWYFSGWLPGRSFVLALIVAKLLGSFLLIDRGLQADYFANAGWLPPAEHSTDFPSRSFTRIDRRLSFGVDRAPDLPLFFLNDAARFNVYREGESSPPFSAVWQGYVRVQKAQDRQMFYLKGKGVTGELWLDNTQAVRLDPTAEESFERASWPSGMRRLTIRVSSQVGGGHQFEAGFVDSNGGKTAFDDSTFLVRAERPWRVLVDRLLRAISTLSDSVLLVILGWCVLLSLYRAVRNIRKGPLEDGLVALGWLAAGIGALAFARAAVGRLVLLQAGQDFLTYEYYGRDIALHGPLMRLGQPAGHASPFYYQPLYPYFIAFAHLVVGEDLSGVYLLHWLLACVAVFFVWKISARLFGSEIGRAALILALLFFVIKLVPLAEWLFSENLFIPLIVVWSWLLIQLTGPSATLKTAVFAGIAGGLATLTRSTLLAGWLVALPFLFLVRRRARLSAWPIVLMIAMMVAVVSLATLRNWIAAGQFVPVTTSFAINLYLGNQPPPGLSIRSAGYTAAVWEYLEKAPAIFVRNLWNKVLYTLGFFASMVPNAGSDPGLIVVWSSSLIAIALMAFRRAPAGPGEQARWLPLLLSLSHFIVVVAMFPHVYGDRLIQPLYILLLPYAALGLTKTLEVLAPPETT